MSIWLNWQYHGYNTTLCAETKQSLRFDSSIDIPLLTAKLRRPEGPPRGSPCSYRNEKETHELIFSWLAWLVVLLVGAYARRRRRQRRSCPTWRPYSKKYVTYSLGLPLTNCWFSDWIAHVGLTCFNQGRVVLKPDSRLNILTKVLFCLFVCFFYWNVFLCFGLYMVIVELKIEGRRKRLPHEVTTLK